MLTPSSLPALRPIAVRKLVCGGNHSFVLARDGTLYSFGQNLQGQVCSAAL